MAALQPGAYAVDSIFERSSTSFKIGLIGLPNSGKSTLFNAISKWPAVAQFFPLPTTETYEAYVKLHNPEFDRLCQIYHPQENVCESLKIIDTPGLVRGAHIRNGHGNSFLKHLRKVDTIFHVFRALEDETIAHVDGAVDVERDLECITLEIQLKDVEFLECKINELQKSLQERRNDKSLKGEYDFCRKALVHLRGGKDIRVGKWNETEIRILETYELLTEKPIVYLANISKTDFQRKKCEFFNEIVPWVKEHGGGTVIPFSGALEQELADVPADVEPKLKSYISKIMNTGFAVSGLIHFFTADPSEVKYWQVRRQTRACEVARTIGRSAIGVEVMKLQDLEELGSESAVKAARKCRQERMTYTIQDGDIIFFR